MYILGKNDTNQVCGVKQVTIKMILIGIRDSNVSPVMVNVLIIT